MLQNPYAKAFVTVVLPLAIAGVVTGQVAAAAPPGVGTAIAVLFGFVGVIAAHRLIEIVRPDLLDRVGRGGV
jgi:predicted membrane channel-forming protein YqfA (hemolysin III family)